MGIFGSSNKDMADAAQDQLAEAAETGDDEKAAAAIQKLEILGAIERGPGGIWQVPGK